MHDARIRATPPASNVRWSLGEQPVLIVHGRTRLREGVELEAAS